MVLFCNKSRLRHLSVVFYVLSLSAQELYTDHQYCMHVFFTVFVKFHCNFHYSVILKILQWSLLAFFTDYAFCPSCTVVEALLTFYILLTSFLSSSIVFVFLSSVLWRNFRVFQKVELMNQWPVFFQCFINRHLVQNFIERLEEQWVLNVWLYFQEATVGFYSFVFRK